MISSNQAKLNFDSHLLITSGVAVEELDGRAHELGQFGLGDVLLSIKTWRKKDLLRLTIIRGGFLTCLT